MPIRSTSVYRLLFIYVNMYVKHHIIFIKSLYIATLLLPVICLAYGEDTV